jgi:general nucleoside transport system ATP-binding protein
MKIGSRFPPAPFYRPQKMTKELVLSLKNLSKRFGTVVANNDVSIDLYRGEVLALLGENGAGKTTLMNMLFGHYMPDSGTVEVADKSGNMVPLPLGHPQLALAAGIGMVHQHFSLAENLSVLDNILLGSENLFSLGRNTKVARKKITAIMDRTGLVAPLDELISQLSVGERQRVELLKALYRDVSILVLDEPTAVLTPQEADSLFANVGAMTKGTETKAGLSVIFISHKMREVLAFSDRIAVLRHGKLVGEMATSDAGQGSIARLMVGEDTPVPQKTAVRTGASVLALGAVSVKGDNARNSLHGVDLDISAGEIVGVAGVSGNGQAALAALVSGLTAPDAGTIHLGDQKMSRHDPISFLGAGVGRIPEDRHHHGVVGAMSVAENLVIERLNDTAIQKNGFLRWNEIDAVAKDLSETYDVRGPGIDAKAQLLSGGNIQKLILARVFESAPKLILANQPTRGLDLGAAAMVSQRLIEARGRGAGVLLISEDLDEILALSDRIYVIHDGELRPAATADRQVIGLMMAGEPV